MSSVYTVEITIKEDGVALPGFPVTKTVTCAEAGGLQTFTRASGASYTELPLAELGQIDLLYVEPSQAGDLRFNDQSDGGLDIQADGCCLLVNCAIPSGASNKAALHTETGSAATVKQVSGGN